MAESNDARVEVLAAAFRGTVDREDGYTDVVFRDAAAPDVTAFVSKDHQATVWRIDMNIPELPFAETPDAVHIAAARLAVRAGLCALALNGILDGAEELGS